MLARHRFGTSLLLAALILVPSLAAQDKKDPPDKETPKKETPKKETPKKEAPDKETPKKEVPDKETPKKETPKKEAPKKEAPRKEARKGWRLGIILGATFPGHHQVVQVDKGSPAEALGLKRGNVIVAVDGKVVRDPRDVRRQLENATSVTIVFHDGKTLYSVDADLEDDSSGFGKKVKGTPKKTEMAPKKKVEGSEEGRLR
jgi:penicillin-insensitive murein endopeptidase